VIQELPGIADAVAEARAAVDALRRHRTLPRYADRVAAEAALRGARASTALEGIDLPLDVVRHAVTAGTQLDAVAAATIEGALRVNAELPALRETWGRAPSQVLARLHTLCAVKLVPPNQLGRPRPDAAVSARLSILGQLLTSRVQAPAVVLAAVVHGELLAAQPFVQGSGLVARAAARLTLMTAGLDQDGFSAPEVGHLELGPAQYADAAAGYATGELDRVAVWVLHCAKATVLGARDMVAFCEAIRRTG